MQVVKWANDADCETIVTANAAAADQINSSDVAVQTDETYSKYVELQAELADLRLKIHVSSCRFRLANIQDDDKKVSC